MPFHLFVQKNSRPEGRLLQSAHMMPPIGSTGRIRMRSTGRLHTSSYRKCSKSKMP